MVEITYPRCQCDDSRVHAGAGQSYDTCLGVKREVANHHFTSDLEFPTDLFLHPTEVLNAAPETISIRWIIEFLHTVRKGKIYK